MAIFRRMPRRTGTGKIQRVVFAAAIQQDWPETTDQGGSWSPVNSTGLKVMGDGYMQDKIVGIVVFLVVGTLMVGLRDTGGADGGVAWADHLIGSLSTAGTWAAAITAMAVAGMAMGVYTNGGLSGANIKQTVLLLIVAAIVGGTGPSGWEWLGVAWLVTGGLRV
jgi:hypothetical protein